MNTLQVKCYLFPQNVSINANSICSANEIRRFALNGNSNLYEQLVDKIQSAYGELLPNKSEIKTYWQDEENELVGFSTDSEMQYACDLLSAIKASKPYEGNLGAVFKVYVSRKVNKEEKPNSEEKPLHFGVTCDGCNGKIYGNRFKCNECPDYDLCEPCEEKKLHTEHTKTKISVPARARCPYAGRNRAFHARHNQNCSNPANLSFQQQLSNIIPQITNNIPLVNSPDQLRNFGEYLKRFLDPIGIDVDYYIDGQRRSSDKPEEKPKTEGDKNKESKSTPVPDTNDLLTSSRLDEPMNEKEKTPEILIPTTSSESSSQSSTASAQASAPSKYELIDFKSSPFESAANALKNVIEKNKQSEKKEEAKDEGDFNLVDIEKELKIINAIEQLKSMGYTDDGGWLTRLVTAKDANINAVLDAISPSKY